MIKPFDLVKKLGGTTKTAEAAGVVPSAVSNWMVPRPGAPFGKIPPQHWQALLSSARARGIELSASDFLSEEVGK